MPYTYYGPGTEKDREAIVDFANYVFSQAHEPHDFRTLLPKAYDPAVTGIEQWHFLAKDEQGKIVGMIAVNPMTYKIFDRTLKAGFVGTVSVHPYHRGEGHMKQLMELAVEDSEKKGFDMLILGGQRQRYNYFGFEKAGVGLRFAVNQRNVRHGMGDIDDTPVTFRSVKTEEDTDFCYALSQALPVRMERPRDNYLRIMHSWHSDLRVVLFDNMPVGYVMGDGMEIALQMESLFPAVIKALMRDGGGKEMDIVCAPWERERIGFLRRTAEYTALGNLEMMRILHYPPVIEALLMAQTHVRPLSDGTFSMLPEGSEGFTIRVKDGVPAVAPGAGPDVPPVDRLTAMNTLFGIETALLPGDCPASWLPLPFYMTHTDTF